MHLLEQFYYRIKVPLFEWKEQRWVKAYYALDPVFRALDQGLLAGVNPYHAARIFPYGETPLRAFYTMAQKMRLQPSDRFVDLGCGRGRGVFFLARFFGCKAIGLDLTPFFISKGKKLAKIHHQERVLFHCQDFLSYDYRKATCLYLYGITYSDEILNRLICQLSSLPIGGRLVTVSQPLISSWVIDEFSVSYPWGTGKMYLHQKKS